MEASAFDAQTLKAKAVLYFQRAQEHDRDDDEFALWLTLGLEFLLRVPLAEVHPSLLAAPEGDSLLHAAGIRTSREPRSLPLHTVVDRLTHVVAEFTPDRADDVRLLTNLRNAELHSGLAALAEAAPSFWLPRLIRVVDVLARHLGEDVEDLLGADVTAHGRALIDSEDKKLSHEIQQRIEEARAFVERLSDEEVAKRVTVPGSGLGLEVVSCPGCSADVGVKLNRVRTTSERFEDGDLVQDVVYVAGGLDCPVCGLTLSGTAEVSAAGIEQQYTREVRETLEERYAQDMYDAYYGND